MKITHITYVNGTDVSNLSDNDIFALVETQQKELKALSEMAFTGPAVKANKARLKANVEELMAAVNSRYDEDPKQA